MLNRRALTYEAAQEAADARDAAGASQDIPICVYDVAHMLNARVRFVDVDMEGMYERGPPSRILLSPYRPLVRRTFSCAHELGHHRFGHGSTVDELQHSSANAPQSEIPEEVLANAFAGFVLMPAIAIQRSFFRRGIEPMSASPLDFYRVACDFGVGYTTLVTHMAYSLAEISNQRRLDLERWKPNDLRRMALGYVDPLPVMIFDDLGEAYTAEVECEYGLLLPIGSQVDGAGLKFERRVANGDLFRAASPGLTRVQMQSRFLDVRVMPKKYVGLAQFRYMENDDD
ncbi:ImmA/IrrE family metallo-endopeptidase [Tardiphaga sp. 1201_B9_N1_1]|uniref:ImmA/IrrE family metallo-endopeptidase n=1 Tax=unclassified Tardiphaga TaxID=2631404 RepID=UPI003F287227